MRTVVFKDNRLTVEDDTLTVSEIKSMMQEIFPELGDSVTFR